MTRTTADVQAAVDALMATLAEVRDRERLERLELERRRREAEDCRRAFRDRVAQINGGWML